MKGEQYFITMRDGVELNITVEEKGHDKWLISTHGIGEYSGRYNFLSEELGTQYNIVRYDLRGHGLSMGEPAFIGDFSDFVSDLDEVIGHIKNRYRMSHYSLFGHSMGALITAAFMNELARESFYPQRVLDLSHNLDIASEYKNDSKNHLSLHSKLIFEMIRYSRKTFETSLNITCPAFLVVGDADAITSCAAIEEFTKKDKSFELKVILGGRHELHNETERYRAPYISFLKKSLAVI